MQPAKIQLVDHDVIQATLRRAGESPRGRMNHNFHAAPTDDPNRMLNVLTRGTYACPHRHITPPKPEIFILLEGQVAFFIFDDDGVVLARHRVGDGTPTRGIDIGAGCWHTLVCLTDFAVCFEVKPGPYCPVTDKDFAPWAPREGDPRAPEYQGRLLSGL